LPKPENKRTIIQRESKHTKLCDTEKYKCRENGKGVSWFDTCEMRETKISLVTLLSPLEIKSRKPSKTHWKVETLHFLGHPSNKSQ